MSAKTKDGKNIELNISASFDYKIITTLNAKDITSKNFQFNVQNINSINFQEVLKLSVKSRLSKKEKSFINRPFPYAGDPYADLTTPYIHLIKMLDAVELIRERGVEKIGKRDQIHAVTE